VSLTRMPSPRAVLAAQTRAVGATLRRPALGAAALLAVVTVAAGLNLLRSGRSLDFIPATSMMPAMGGMLFPVVVWLHEDRFGAGFVWTLPVDRRRHALTRVAAGWLWLLLGVLAVVLWMLGMTLVSGGTVIGPVAVRVLPSLRETTWTPSPALWLVPFTAATGTYLLASAVALGIRHPARWLAALAASLYVVSEGALTAGATGVALMPSRAFSALLYGRYGLDTLFSARAESLRTAVPSGDRMVTAWHALPNVGDWAVGTALWIAAGALALWLASARHGERRRR
jgi:hypothetical protein